VVTYVPPSKKLKAKVRAEKKQQAKVGIKVKAPKAVEFMALKTSEDNDEIIMGGDYGNEEFTDDVRTNEEAYEEQIMQMQFRQNKYGKFGHNLDPALQGNSVFFNEDGSDGDSSSSS
jgi:hypothetical protein